MIETYKRMIADFGSNGSQFDEAIKKVFVFGMCSSILEKEFHSRNETYIEYKQSASGGVLTSLLDAHEVFVDEKKLILHIRAKDQSRELIRWAVAQLRSIGPKPFLINEVKKAANPDGSIFTLQSAVDKVCDSAENPQSKTLTDAVNEVNKVAKSTSPKMG